VELKDGRKLRVQASVNLPRPQATLMNKGVQENTSAAPSPVQLGSADDLPLEGRLVFFLKSTVPAKFPRNGKVELAASDGSFGTQLSLADGSLILADAQTAMGSVDPFSRFGPSAFGPVRLRVLSADGATGDWMPLGTLVRMPGFKDLRCPRALAKPCILTGTNLFLADSIAASQNFEAPTIVPQDFTGTQLNVPHPANGMLYLKLRDDPITVQTLVLPVTQITPAESKAAAAQIQAAPAAQPAAEPSDTAPPVSPEATVPANPQTAVDPSSGSPAGTPAARPDTPTPRL